MRHQISEIFRQVRRIGEKGSFVQNVSLIFSGNVLNFLLQFAFAPIISRVYAPEAYGTYAYYNLIVSNIGFIGAMSLPSVYVLPKTRLEFLSLAKVVVYFQLFLTLLSLLIFLVFEGLLFDFEGELMALPFIGLLIFLNAINTVSASWNARSKRFGRNAYVGVLSNLTSKSFTWSVGAFWKPLGIGLFVGDVVRSFFVFFTQTSFKIKLSILKFLWRQSNWKEVWGNFKKNVNVPKYVFPSQLLNKWTSDIPLLVIGGYYSKEMLGFYTFALTMLNIPKNLVATALQPVVYQKVNELYLQKDEKLPTLLTYSFLGSVIFFMVPFTLLSIFGTELFVFFFGEEWAFSGKVMLVVSSEIVLSTIMIPFGGIRRIFGFEKKILGLTILSVLLKGCAFLGLFLFEIDFLDFLLIYASLNSFWILINQMDMLWSIVGKKKALMVFSVCFVLFISSILIIKSAQ